MTTLDEWFHAVDRLLDGELSAPSHHSSTRSRWMATIPTLHGELRLYDSADGARLVLTENGESVEFLVPHGDVGELARELQALSRS